jgi:DNA (cytosine-5)-methyltransferase 1
MKVLELFAGAGGAALGLHAAGMEAVAHVEWNKDACATMRMAGLAPVFEGDVRDLDAIEETMTGTPDVLWSSFPCQAWSQAGRRLGANDPRNGWPWTVDAIDRFEPAWFIAENVKGLTHHASKAGCDRAGSRPEECPGCYLAGVILPQLRERFAYVEARVLDAADYGVPQHRTRLIIIAGPRPVQWPEATHGPGAPLPYVSMGEALGLSTVPGMPPEWRHLKRLDRPSPCVSATEVKCGTLANRSDGRPRINRASCALQAATGRKRLTVEECAILQGFPADHAFAGTSLKTRYMQVGNAVPPRLAEVVGRAIVKACE